MSHLCTFVCSCKGLDRHQIGWEQNLYVNLYYKRSFKLISYQYVIDIFPKFNLYSFVIFKWVHSTETEFVVHYVVHMV
jgi:hypothetical protein